MRRKPLRATETMGQKPEALPLPKIYGMEAQSLSGASGNATGETSNVSAHRE